MFVDSGGVHRRDVLAVLFEELVPVILSFALLDLEALFFILD